MKSIFDKSGLDVITERVKALEPESKALWGKMDVSQMMAHCNVAFEMTYDNIHKRPGVFKRFFLKLFIKKAVVGPKPYPKNGPTAPEFKISEAKDFEKEQSRLLAYLAKTHDHGSSYFEGRESHSFGPLTSDEWNVMFVKHLDHHLQQFGV